MSSMVILEPNNWGRNGGGVEVEELTGDRLPRLESDVKHIQTDVSDIKSDLRRTNDKVDRLGERLDAKIDRSSERLDTKIDDLGVRLETKIDAMGSKLSAKIDTGMLWLMGFITTLGGGLLAAMAKGFKWF